MITFFSCFCKLLEKQVVPVVRLEPATLALRAPCLSLWAALQVPAQLLLVPSSFSLLPVALKSESLPDVSLEPATLWSRVALSSSALSDLSLARVSWCFYPSALTNGHKRALPARGFEAVCGLAAQLLTPRPPVLVWAVFSWCSVIVLSPCSSSHHSEGITA